MQKAALPKAPPGATAESVVERIRVPFIQKARLVKDGAPRDVFLVDLGLLGVFAESEEAFSIGDRIEVRFRLPGNEIPIVADCEVAWRHVRGEPPVTLPTGVGLHFDALEPSDRERLREYLADYCRRGRGRRFARHWPQTSGKGGEP